MPEPDEKNPPESGRLDISEYIPGNDQTEAREAEPGMDEALATGRRFGLWNFVFSAQPRPLAYHRDSKPPAVLERGRTEGEGEGHSRFQLSFLRRAEICCPETPGARAQRPH